MSRGCTSQPANTCMTCAVQDAVVNMRAGSWVDPGSAQDRVDESGQGIHAVWGLGCLDL